MDDLISRQMLLEYIHGEPVGRLLCDKYNLDGLIKQLPSAQPEIIYCKDCKWKQGAECVRFADVRPFPSDFCSRAERRTDG